MLVLGRINKSHLIIAPQRYSKKIIFPNFRAINVCPINIESLQVGFRLFVVPIKSSDFELFFDVCYKNIFENLAILTIITTFATIFSLIIIPNMFEGPTEILGRN